MICEKCREEKGPLSYDVEYGGCLCEQCRRALNMNIKARSCPFCGLKNHTEVISTGPNSNIVYYVRCSNCGARGPLSSRYNDAVSDWNIAARVRE